MRISDWSSDVCSSDLPVPRLWPRPAISLDVPVELQCRADQQSACHRRAHAARYIDGRLQADDDGAGTGRREYRGRSGGVERDRTAPPGRRRGLAGPTGDTTTPPARPQETVPHTNE